MNFLDGLNPTQQQAVEHTEGPVLVLAGAGSGKTRVITHRIAHLITACRVPGWAVMAVTFTNKASGEMRDRVRSLVPTGPEAAPTVATFHSFCVRLLRRDGAPLAAIRRGFTPLFTIYDADDQLSLLKGVYKNLGLDDKFMQHRAALSRISQAKSQKQTPEDLARSATDPIGTRFATLYERYETRLRESNALDFDDLLLKAVDLLHHDDETRQRLNRRYEFVMVDEYQDTNRSQYELMRLMTQDRQNICVVGDEDQSIYSWRGANIRNILDFERDFPGAITIRLEQNYRSTQNILEAAGAVVANNTERIGKTLWTESGAGDKITLYEAPDSENEALWIADTIESRLSRNPTERVAILYRTNSQSRQIEEALRRYGRKYIVVGGFSFYQRAEVKDILSYLKVLTSPDDSISLLRVINTPARGIGRTTIEQVEQYALQHELSMWGALGRMLEGARLPGEIQDEVDEKPVAKVSINKLGNKPANLNKIPEQYRPINLFSEHDEADDSDNQPPEISFEGLGVVTSGAGSNADQAPASSRVDHGLPARAEAALLAFYRMMNEMAAQLETRSIADTLADVLERTGYRKMLEDGGTEDSRTRLANLDELLNAATDASERGETLRDFLDHAALVADSDSLDQRAPVSLLTMHNAKGLEFPVVFIAGLEEGLFPHSRSLDSESAMEEERRLCYVGMTRAEKKLYLSWARFRRRFGGGAPEASLASRFLKEAPSKLVDSIRGGAPEISRPVDLYAERSQVRESANRNLYTGKTYNSVENIKQFFSEKGTPSSYPASASKAPVAAKAGPAAASSAVPKKTGVRKLGPGSTIEHAKYGRGTVLRLEGTGEDTKVTVSFPGHGLKKLIAKFAGIKVE